jgi:hypothetical protein
MTARGHTQIDDSELKTTPTYWANIYVGLKPGYDAPTIPPQAAMDIAQVYVDKVGLCVTITPTTFVYTKGYEPGFIIGLINYPRFPATPQKITHHALALARALQKGLRQHRISVMFPDRTVMLDADTVQHPADRADRRDNSA